MNNNNNNNNLFARNLVLFDFKPPIFPPFKIQNININLKNYTRRYAEVASLIKRALAVPFVKLSSMLIFVK